jgi:hypothetical protein
MYAQKNQQRVEQIIASWVHDIQCHFGNKLQYTALIWWSDALVKCIQWETALQGNKHEWMSRSAKDPQHERRTCEQTLKGEAWLQCIKICNGANQFAGIQKFYVWCITQLTLVTWQSAEYFKAHPHQARRRPSTIDRRRPSTPPRLWLLWIFMTTYFWKMTLDLDSDVELSIFGNWAKKRGRSVCQRRTIWVHDTIQKRQVLGEFHRLVQNRSLPHRFDQ